MNLSGANSILTIVALASTSSAFVPKCNNAKARCSCLHMGTPGMDLSGNSWKPDSEKMGVSRLHKMKANDLVSKLTEKMVFYILTNTTGW